MSEIVEKTLALLPGIIASSLGAKKESYTSRGFQNFVQNFSNLKSKHEEDQFIKKELSLQKQKLSQPSVTAGQKRESLLRLVYCHMLGYDVTFGFIHAVKLAQQGSILQKQVGYLVCSLFLHENHELVMLLINTIQKDLKSTNILEVCSALTAATRLISPEMIPALLPMVEEKTRHPKEIIRKKAIMCLHSFHLKAPGLVQHVEHLFHQALCDKDPGVMWAASYIYADLIQKDPALYQKMVPGFINILQQVIGRRLHTEYDYHSVPAPWLTIHLLKLLRMLGTGNQQSSQQMYQVLKEVMQRTEPSHKMGLAVIFECLETIAFVYPHPALLEHAANCVGRFLSANSINLKYLGLKALTSVIQVNAQYALPHQKVVIECLEHRDYTIRKKTLELLYKMANPSNAQVICSKMLEQLDSDSDQHAKLDVVYKVCSLVERFSQSGQWYIDTMNQVLLKADSLGPHSLGCSITTLLATEAEKPDCNRALLEYAASTYWQLLHRESIPETLLQVAIWAVGSHHKYLTEQNVPVTISRLCTWYSKAQCDETKSTLLMALLKLQGQAEAEQEELETVLKAGRSSHNKEIVQRAQELEGMTKSSAHLRSVVSTASVEKEELDLTLSFLDEYVAESLERGEQPYQPHGFRHPQPQKLREPNPPLSGLNFLPYVSPVASAPIAQSSSLPPTSQERAALSASSGESAGKEQIGLHLKGVKRVWGKEGLVHNDTSAALPVPTVDKQETPPQLTQTDGPGSISIDVSHCDPTPEMDCMQKEVKRKQDLAEQLFSGLAPGPPIAETNVASSAGLSSSMQAPRPSTSSPYTMDDSERAGPASCSASGFDWRMHKASQNASTADGSTLDFSSSCAGNSQTLREDGVLDLTVRQFNNPDEEAHLLATLHANPCDENEDSDFNQKGSASSMYSTFVTHNSNKDESQYQIKDQRTTNIGTAYLPLGSDIGAQIEQVENHMNGTETVHEQNPDALLAEQTETVATDSRVFDSQKKECTTSGLDCSASTVCGEQSSFPESAPQVIGGNAAVRAHCQKVWRQDSLTVHIHVERLQEADEVYQGATLTVNETMGDWQLELKCDGQVSAHLEAALVFTDGRECQLTLVCVAACDVAVPDFITASVCVPKSDSDVCDIKIPVDTLDFIRPCSMTVDVFAKQWATCSLECRLQASRSALSGNQTSLSDSEVTTASGLADRLHLCLVQSTGGEHLLAGQWLNSAQHILLAHCQTNLPNSGTMQLWIRTSSHALLSGIGALLA